MGKLHDALLEIQKDPPELLKDARNPHFKQEYITLDAVLEAVVPVLNGKGILLIQETTSVGPNPAIATILYHTESEESIGSAMPLILDRESPQGVGSAITYYRRYGLLALLGLTADSDDDAEGATRRESSSRDSKSSSGDSGQKKGSTGF